MSRRRNPFTPTFGIVPPHLAGRARLLDEMGDAFENGLGDPNLCTVLVGARGCGKTALLSCIADEAARHGWISVAAQGAAAFGCRAARDGEEQGCFAAPLGSALRAGRACRLTATVAVSLQDCG